MTQFSEHSVVMKSRRVHLEQERVRLREGTLFTDIEGMAVISHKRPQMPFFAIDAFLPFPVFFWD